MKLHMLPIVGGLTLGLAAACAPQHSQADPPAVRQIQGDGYSLEIIDNSETFSQALAINASGQMIGMREVAGEQAGIFSQESFFFDGQQSIKLPQLEGFTNLEVAALSDTGRAVGYASRPIGHPGGSLTAVLWDSATGQLTRLPPIAGDTACQAHDISSDGLRVSGYSNGSNPPRIRPCVWSYNPKSQNWEVEVLSVLDEYNPYLVASNVLLSPDGQRVAACITVARYPNGQFDSSLFAWEWSSGQWKRRPVSDEQLVLRDMNNRGEIAGTYTGRNGRDPCFVDAAGKLVRIGIFAGDVSGEARGVNAEGTVVGFSDDPGGPEGGPQAFVWSAGKSRAMALPEETVFSSAFGINDRGQIAGLLDVTLSPAPPRGEATKPAEATVKTLAFRWTPAPP